MEKAARKPPSLEQAPLLAQSTCVAWLLPPGISPQILAQFLPEVSLKGCLKPAGAKKKNPERSCVSWEQAARLFKC